MEERKTELNNRQECFWLRDEVNNKASGSSGLNSSHPAKAHRQVQTTLARPH